MPVCPQCRNENPELGAKCPRCAESYYVYEDAVEAAADDPYIGSKAADKYVVVSLISHGGMGSVYRALQLPVEREVALKVLRTELENDSEVRNRFTREARAVSQINHPNIITLHDFGFDTSGYPYMVMEYAPGKGLEQWIYGSGITLQRILHVSHQLLSALADAHDQGIVHRDLKPENIVVSGTGRDRDFIKLLDFGIARLVNERATEGLTREGEVFGTPHYMSPEQAEGRTDVGRAADVYAAGIMIYEMLCGHEPFDAPKPLSILYKQINEELPPIEGRPGVEVPDGIARIIRRATRKDPEERFEDAGAMVRALEDEVGGAGTSGVHAVPAPDVTDETDPPAPTSGGTEGPNGPPGPASSDTSPNDSADVSATLGLDDADPEESARLGSTSSVVEAEEADKETVFVDDRESASLVPYIAAAGGAVALAVVGFFLLWPRGEEERAASEKTPETETSPVVAGADTATSPPPTAGTAPAPETTGAVRSDTSTDGGDASERRVATDDETPAMDFGAEAESADSTDEEPTAETSPSSEPQAADSATGSGAASETESGTDTDGRGGAAGADSAGRADRTGSQQTGSETSDSSDEPEKFGAPDESSDDSSSDPEAFEAPDD